MHDFDEYAAARGSALLRLAYVLTGDRHAAEDLVQDVLATAYRKWRRVGAADDVDAYVRTMLVRRHVSWRRRRWHGEVATGDALDRPASGDHVERQATHEALWQLLATLPPRQRAVLALRYYDDQSDAQVAEALGCTVSTVRSQASRALAALRLRTDVLEELR